jgi:hypothetical protein
MIKQGMNILEQNAKKRLDFNPDLQQINFLDRRVYKRGEGIYYPSVTTILQYMPKNKFFECQQSKNLIMEYLIFSKF